MNNATGTAQVYELPKSRCIGTDSTVRVVVKAKSSEEALAVRATLMAAERLTGASPRPVLKGGKYSTWHETYSRDAGYLWGASTGWLYAAYEVA